MDTNNTEKKHKNIASKGLVKSILFFTIPIIMLFIISNVYKEILYKNNDLASDRYKSTIQANSSKKDSYEVVVVGDSITYAAVSPLDMWNKHGFTGYALTTEGQAIQQTYYNLKEFYKNQSPKVVVIESNLIFKNKGYPANAANIAREAMNYYMPGIKYHNVWKANLGNTKPTADYYKGHEIKTTVGKCKNIDYMIKTDKKAKINPINQYYLDEIVNLCKNKGSKVCILSLPTQKKADGSKDGKYEEYNCLKKYTDDNKLGMINMNKMCLDKEMSIDWAISCADPSDTGEKLGGEHLNEIGAQIATEKLGDYLSKEYNLEDHRKDEKYSSWTKDYENFEKIRAKIVKDMKNKINN